MCSDQALASFTEGVRLYHGNHPAEAIQHFRTALAIDPTCPDAHKYIGLSLCALNRISEAVDEFQQAARQQPDDAQVHFFLARTFEELGRSDDAFACYRAIAGGAPGIGPTMADINRKAFDLPIATDPGAVVSVHTLLCTRFLVSYLYAVKSLVLLSGLPLAIYVYDDGTLTPDDVQVLHTQVIGITIIPVVESLPCLSPPLSKHPNCTRLFQENVFGKRLFGVVEHARTEKVILLDADILFLQKPDAICAWATQYQKDVQIDIPTPSPFQGEGRGEVPAPPLLGAGGESLFIRDPYDHTSSITPEISRTLGLHYIPHFNAGLVCTGKSYIDLDLAEDLAGALHDQSPPCHPWIVEQTILAGLLSRHRHEPLPPSYSFVNAHNFAQAKTDLQSITARHYSFPKALIFAEGATHLIETGIF